MLAVPNCAIFVSIISLLRCNAEFKRMSRLRFCHRSTPDLTAEIFGEVVSGSFFSISLTEVFCCSCA